MSPSLYGRTHRASSWPWIAGALGAILIFCTGLMEGRIAVANGVPDNVVLLSNLSYRDGSRACVLDLALPKGRANRPRPAIVVIHGGGWNEGDKSSFDVQRTPGNIIDFAAVGFVAASVNYRLSGEAPFPAGLYDCQAAVRWLRAHAREYDLDANRIGAYGNSAGGHLALLLGLLGPASRLEERGGPFPAESSGVEAVVSDSGPIDLVAEHKHGTIRTVIERFLGGAPDQKRLAAYQAASPINHLAGKTPPLLLIYGEADNQVDARTADRLVSELSQRGRREISYFRLAGVGHCPHSLIRIPYLRPVVIDFFQRTLGK